VLFFLSSIYIICKRLYGHYYEAYANIPQHLSSGGSPHAHFCLPGSSEQWFAKGQEITQKRTDSLPG
jgi:hypothetical protein